MARPPLPRRHMAAKEMRAGDLPGIPASAIAKTKKIRRIRLILPHKLPDLGESWIYRGS